MTKRTRRHYDANFKVRVVLATLQEGILPRLTSYLLGRSSQLYVVMSIVRLRELERMVGREQAAMMLSAEPE